MTNITGRTQACSQVRGTARFDRAKFFPNKPPDLLGQFTALFHRYGYIYKPFNGDSWLSANERWRLTDTEILKAAACEHKQYLLGARSGKTTRFAVLDIDAGSRYHNRADLHRMINLLMDAGLSEPVLYRSSNSGGWHLYIFFDEAVPSREVQKLLIQLLVASGFTLRPGTLEVFPNRGDSGLGCGLRLPLQPGWAWLDSNCLDVLCERTMLTPAAALSRFMADLTDFGNTREAYSQFRTAVQELVASREEIARKVERALGNSNSHIQIANELAIAGAVRIFKKLPPGMNPDTWWRGRGYFESGLTGPSQRADALFSLNHYLFYGDPEKVLEPLGYGYAEERRYAIESILAAKNHGQSKDLNRNRSDATAQIGRASRWLPAHKRTEELARYKKVVPLSWVRHNGNLKAKSIERIKYAIAYFVSQAKPFTVKELLEKSGVKSLGTLYSHKAVWHSIYEELKSLPSGITDEYNVVVGAAGLESGTPAPDSVTDMPPGRLAARRVVLQLAKKTETDHKNGQKDIESISDRYATSWKSKVLAALPTDFDALTARQLKSCAPILLSLLPGAPDEEHQIWLQEKLQIIWNRLAELQKSWAEAKLQELELSG